MTNAVAAPSLARRAALALILAGALAGCASGGPVPPSEPDALVEDARITLNNFLRDPDQTWIQANLGSAKAVLIAPKIVKAGFIFGGSGGRAVLVAKDGRVWTGPAFYDLATASVGLSGGRRSVGARDGRDDGEGAQLAAVELVQESAATRVSQRVRSALARSPRLRPT